MSLSMQTNVVSAEHIENHFFQEKYQNIILDIQKDVSKKTGKENEMMVIVHPTEYTQNLLEIAECEVHYERILTALATAIDMKKMYAFGLFNAMNASSSLEDRNAESEQLFHHLVNLFCHSETLGKLQEFVRDTVDSGESFGWLPCGEKNGFPFVPKHYVVIYVPSTDTYIARDIEGRNISLHFINKLATHFKPRSTVTFMKDRYHSMQMIRNYKMISLHYASRPVYLTKHKEEKTDEAQQQMLDVKIVNQNKVNETLENMISQNLAGLSSKQKYTSTKHSLNNFLQQMSSDIVEKNKTNTELKKKLQEAMKTQTEQSDMFVPFSRQIEEGEEMAGSQLGVSFIDTREEETKYEREWMCTAFGGIDDHNTSHSRQRYDGKGKYSEDSHSFVEKKALFYQNIIIYELLSAWVRVNDIPLSVIPSESKMMDVSRLMDMKNLFSPSLFSMLLSHATNVPLHFVATDTTDH